MQENQNVRLVYRHRRRRLLRLRRLQAKKRIIKERQSWEAFQTKLSDRQLRRYFRMSRDYFRHLCERVEQNIEWSTFKSEQYLRELCPGTVVQSTRGFVSGEVELALTLRVLAGGYLHGPRIIIQSWNDLRVPNST